MAVTVFDEMHIMKNEGQYADIDSTIEALETLLNMHNIAHSFTLPHPTILNENPAAAAIMYYNSENRMTVNLIYALYCKAHRGLENARIAKALIKMASHYIED